MERKQPHVGNAVIFTDAEGDDRPALVKAVFGEASEGYMPCINMVTVSKDESCQDRKGRQTECDPTSIVHVSDQAAHGNYWRWPHEEKKPYQEPTEQ